MAACLLSHEVSDLCIGKPPLKFLPITATVGEALAALKSCGETFIGVLATEKENDNETLIAGKICMLDVICYLCSEVNIHSPASALKNSVSVLLKDREGLVRRVESNASILEALDAILGDDDMNNNRPQTLVVPINSGIKKTCKHQQICWLTQEDLVRFFLDNIFLFPNLAPLSITTLDLIHPTTLSTHPYNPALSALPLIRSALKFATSVAIVTGERRLIGEISPSTLSVCAENVAAAIVTLSAGELISYIDCSSCGLAPDCTVQTVKGRLKENGLNSMVELLDNEQVFSSSSSSSSSCSGWSSSDEESSGTKKPRPMWRMGSYSARMGRRAEEAIVCHPESSLVAVMVQALAHRVSYVWVVDEDDYVLLGIVRFLDVLSLFREQLR